MCMAPGNRCSNCGYIYQFRLKVRSFSVAHSQSTRNKECLEWTLLRAFSESQCIWTGHWVAKQAYVAKRAFAIVCCAHLCSLLFLPFFTPCVLSLVSSEGFVPSRVSYGFAWCCACVLSLASEFLHRYCTCYASAVNGESRTVPAAFKSHFMRRTRRKTF